MTFTNIKPKSNQSVTYLDHMGSDLSVVNHARVSFDKKSEWMTDAATGEVVEDANYKRDCELIEYLATGMRKRERRALMDGMVSLGINYYNGEVDANETFRLASLMVDRIQGIQKHWSPFSHCMASFQLVVPIFVARQIHRSGIGFAPPLADDFGFSEESRRYVSDEPDFFQPAEWREANPDVKQGSGGAHALSSELDMMHENVIGVASNDYSYLIANNVAAEQARMFLPQSTMTKFNWTGSLYAWANLVRQRIDPHAQAESQEIALLISEEMRKLFPVSWKALVRC